jgi:hypothetical protein
MPVRPDPRDLARAVEAVSRHGTQTAAAAALGIPRETLRHRLAQAKLRASGSPSSASDVDIALLKDQVRTLKAQLRDAQAQRLDEEHVRRVIFKLADQPREPPEWLVRKPARGHVTGVPILFASDWHWGERVEASQIGGANAYDMAIAHRRARTMVEVAISLLRDRFVNPVYPGMVMALGGDMVSGDIHEELTATNEVEIGKAYNDLVDVLEWCIATLAAEFGKLFIPCVTGNHGRMTHKIRAKGRAFTNFDWLAYTALARRFRDDERIQFLIPDGPDAHFTVYRTRYCLVHGDAFRGGDGMVGALGPIIRGDHRKRGRNAQIGAGYDVLLLGHWHQQIHLERLIVNGSLKGYDEYAYGLSFPYEPPRQSLWITHPEQGITFRLPVNVERPVAESSRPAPWVSWPGSKS